MKKTVLFLLFVLTLDCIVNAQEVEEFNPKIRGAIMMANSHVPYAKEQGKSVSVIPTWGVDVDYFFHPRWSTALQSDILLQSFEVEHDNVLLQRNYPISITGVIHYHALHHWSLYLGPGYEFEKNENLLLMRLGTEYSFELSKNFEIALNLIYEKRQEVYDTWTFGIAFNTKLWTKK